MSHDDLLEDQDNQRKRYLFQNEIIYQIIVRNMACYHHPDKYHAKFMKQFIVILTSASLLLFGSLCAAETAKTVARPIAGRPKRPTLASMLSNLSS